MASRTAFIDRKPKAVKKPEASDAWQVVPKDHYIILQSRDLERLDIPAGTKYRRTDNTFEALQFEDEDEDINDVFVAGPYSMRLIKRREDDDEEYE